jgi:hypothetical protein
MSRDHGNVGARSESVEVADPAAVAVSSRTAANPGLVFECRRQVSGVASSGSMEWEHQDTG